MSDTPNDSMNYSAGAATLRPGGGSAGPGDLRMKMVSDVVAQMLAMPDEDLNGFMKSLERYDPATSIGDPSEANRASIDAKPSAAVNNAVREDLERMFASEDGGAAPLSEEFVVKATTLFEAAVSTRVALELESINEQQDELVAQRVDEAITEFAERVDSYASYVAENWINENRIAIEAGIRADLTESFMSGLRELFVEHYIDIPEDKVDTVTALTNQVADLEEDLNRAINENIALSEQLNDFNAAAVIAEATEGLTRADADRLVALSEDLTFSDADELRRKVNVLRETLDSSTSRSTGLLIEEIGIDDDGFVAGGEQPSSSARMQAYRKAISRSAAAEK